jgi:uncharacterized protein YjbI with pentapeptide repeats
MMKLTFYSSLLFVLASCGYSNNKVVISGAAGLNCEGPYSSPLSDDPAVSRLQKLERINVLRTQAPASRGCVNLSGMNFYEFYSGPDAELRAALTEGYNSVNEWLLDGGYWSSPGSYATVEEALIAEWESYNLTDAYLERHLEISDLNFENVLLKNASFENMSMLGADLSKTKGLAIESFHNLVASWNPEIVYPELDFTNFSQFLDVSDDIHNPTPMINFRGSDLSRVKNLRVELLNQSSSLRDVVLPAMDVTGLDLTGKQIINCDFSRVTGLTVAMLNSAGISTGMILPDMNVEGLISCPSCDLRNVTTLTQAQFLALSSLAGIKLPAIDLTGINFTGRGINGIDFSRTTGLTVEILNDSAVSDYRNVVFPIMDVTGLNVNTFNFRFADLTRVTGLTVAMLNSMLNIQNIKLPPINITGLNTAPASRINGIDFTRTEGLTEAMLNSANSIIGIKLPSMTITGALNTARSIGGIDFSLTNGLTIAQVNAATYLGSTIFPAMDFTGYAGGKDLTGADLRAVQNFTQTHFDSSISTSASNIKFPAMTLTDITLLNKNYTGADFTLTTGAVLYPAD